MALGLQITRNMDTINIEEWAGGCLDTKTESSCC